MGNSLIENSNLLGPPRRKSVKMFLKDYIILLLLALLLKTFETFTRFNFIS